MKNKTFWLTLAAINSLVCTIILAGSGGDPALGRFCFICAGWGWIAYMLACRAYPSRRNYLPRSPWMIAPPPRPMGEDRQRFDYSDN